MKAIPNSSICINNEDALDEADRLSKEDCRRLTHNEVFDELRKESKKDE